ncbi:hypothetical protein [Halosegnis longus]|uniref:Uncharacterized protein n=1 Tax=Halosegnis longus TaxID=2216012 RepID=A0AAJ4UUJ3_9EURY|nr:hypothetical protein Nmn1133_13985 [Salella cibi]
MAANRIKRSGGGLALQVTMPAREAGLVRETDNGDVHDLADVFIVVVDGTLLVGNREQITGRDRIELVDTLARDAESLYRIMDASIQPEGNGYQVQLPNAGDAGFEHGDRAPVTTGNDLLVIHDGEPRRVEWADAVVALRGEQ